MLNSRRFIRFYISIIFLLLLPFLLSSIASASQVFFDTGPSNEQIFLQLLFGLPGLIVFNFPLNGVFFLALVALYKVKVGARDSTIKDISPREFAKRLFSAVFLATAIGGIIDSVMVFTLVKFSYFPRTEFSIAFIFGLGAIFIFLLFLLICMGVGFIRDKKHLFLIPGLMAAINIICWLITHYLSSTGEWLQDTMLYLIAVPLSYFIFFLFTVFYLRYYTDKYVATVGKNSF